jgi:hypothetical protein
MYLLQAAPDQDTAEALLHLAFIVGMAFLLVGGTVAVIVLWYVRGRDPATHLHAEYITEPPDDLPPGAAGTLLDESVDHEDVVATMIGLARHGAIEIHEIPPDPGKQQRRSNYELIVVDPSKVESRLERDLLQVLFQGDPKRGDREFLHNVKARFDANEPTIRHDLYRELVDRGYFTTAPDDTRRRWKIASWIGLVASIVVGLVVTARTDGFALLPTAAAVVIWIMMIRMSKAMPQKTAKGAESAAQWRAFRTYLRSISKYEKVEEAKPLFDRYMSYAVAFGIEKQWLATFAAAGATAPAWINTHPLDGGGWDIGDVVIDTMYAGHIFGNIGGGDVNLPDVGMPNVDIPNVGMPDLGGLDVDTLSSAMGGGLEAASGGLAGLLDIAGGIFDSIDFDL